MRYWYLFVLFFSSSIVAQESEKLKLQVEDYGRYDEDLLSPEFHKGRREALLELMPENSCLFLFSSPVKVRSNDVNYEYHQDRDFYYLTGLCEPHSVLLLVKDGIEVNGRNTNEVLFVQSREPGKEVWNGQRFGVEGVLNVLKIDEALDHSEFKDFNFSLKNKSKVFMKRSYEDVRDDPYNKKDLFSLQVQLSAHLLGVNEGVVDESKLYSWMAKLREIKQEEELALMRKAIDITCLAQEELMKALTPGMREFESEAIVEYIFKRNGAEYPGFPSIQGSGNNACILHYQNNRKVMLGDHLLVSDIGAEYHGYTADVTRTLPVDGKFSYVESTIYNIVLEAQNAGIEASQVGSNFWDPNIAATTVISQRLMELEIIKSPIEVRKYFMHGTSHYLGLDVHDQGTFDKLKPNNVITVEPGIYIPEGSPCDEKWWGIGVRIEDDILITNEGPVNLSGELPRTISEIETLMEGKSTLNK